MRLFLRLCTRQLGALDRAGAKAEDGARSLKIAVIGTPNVGKSALTNRLVKSDVCAVSKLIDTTRQNMTTSYSEGNCQLVVVDSPGLIGIQHAKKMVGTHAESKILVDPEKALTYADHVLVVCDATAPGEYIHHRVLHLLHRNSHIPSSLVLNKCDLIKQRTDLLRLAQILTNGVVDGARMTVETARLGKLGTSATERTLTVNPLASHMGERDEKWKQAYNRILNKPTHKCSWHETKHVFQQETGWPHFSGVFFVSAITGEGDRGPPLASPVALRRGRVAVPEKPQWVISEHIRSAMLNSLPADIAYRLVIRLMHFEMESDEMNVLAHVIAEKERAAKLAAAVLPEQASELEARFSKLFNRRVNVELLAKFNGKTIFAQ
ncbi:G domain-containing protein [Aphelenchoides fujianensis]|nr:G domain-containing protein [Aphelenchoides fujianensis]